MKTLQQPGQATTTTTTTLTDDGNSRDDGTLVKFRSVRAPRSLMRQVSLQLSFGNIKMQLGRRWLNATAMSFPAQSGLQLARASRLRGGRQDTTAPRPLATPASSHRPSSKACAAVQCGLPAPGPGRMLLPFLTSVDCGRRRALKKFGRSSHSEGSCRAPGRMQNATFNVTLLPSAEGRNAGPRFLMSVTASAV
ncbi:hypothetical protein LZ32DRAFT_459631 [Colletotrichum eremochloae]|nr:hypothetical protein LZ32DRAFT_459631 [Colletotrichum eremochloae]